MGNGEPEVPSGYVIANSKFAAMSLELRRGLY